MSPNYSRLLTKRLVALAFVCCFAVPNGVVKALGSDKQVYKEGKVEGISVLAGKMADTGIENIVWEQELEFSGTTTLRLHFTDIEAGATDKYEITLRDIGYNITATVPSDEFVRNGEYWSDWLPGSYVLVQVKRLARQVPTDLSFRIDKVVLESREPKSESIVGDRDFEYPASTEDESLWGASRSVAKLSFVDGDRAETCTGFMIDTDRLITNQHCVRNAEVCRSLLAIFGYEYDRRFKRQDGKAYRCLRIVGAPNEQLDFVVLEMAGQPGLEHAWGYLRVARERLQEGQSLVIVQHPSGELKRFVKKDCRVSTEMAPNRMGLLHDFGHTCDTDTGSSGSPVLNSDYELVGLHHLGFEEQDPRWLQENRGVWLSEILNALHELGEMRQ